MVEFTEADLERRTTLAEVVYKITVLVHHASKGNQSGKSLTDVGAGAGSQSR